MNWFFLTMVCFFLYGIQRFLYKVSAERNCNTAWTTLSFMGTVALLSAVCWFASDETLINPTWLLALAVINSLTFFVDTVVTIEALRYLPTNIVYPMTRLNAVLVVLFSIVYFKDSLNGYQIAGIVLAIGVILTLTRFSEEERKESRNFHKGFLLIGLAVLSGAVAAVSSKFAALYTNSMAFIALTYSLSMLFSVGLQKPFEKEGASRRYGEALLIGFLVGLVNFAAFVTLLSAMKTGPLSIIVPVVGMNFVLANLLAAVVYREKLTLLKTSGILMTVLSLLLMKLGQS
ncbi:EamA-like transporter family protein [Syntrophus gentianae]|uniref:EamA-like transporter family protein n=1 Tax=Syntrophus gentianae TaxID=43775 RepID=A0A1H7YCN1_9BACT|nr:EamA family transporter [Syntrophus gentianae]SEM43661.1 EamA-like transporter family protein [Syntrophus gentianae]